MSWVTLIFQVIVALPKILELIATLLKSNPEKDANDAKDKAGKEIDDAKKRWEEEDKA